MSQIILGPQPKKSLDGSVKKAAFSFLEKLQANDASPGLHIEPIIGSMDSRVRTGRVNEFWRAVLVQIQGRGDTHYVYLGTFPHDDAIAFAKTASVRINPRNGIAELIKADRATRRDAPVLEHTTDLSPLEQSEPLPSATTPLAPSLLELHGVSLKDLLGLGLDASLAEKAITVGGVDAADAESAMLELADTATVAWQGLALVDLAVGTPLAEVAEKLALPDAAPLAAAADAPTDDQLIDSLQHPASRLDFAFIENDASLRAAIEDEDFGRWRVFLHPEQRAYATKNRNGSFRLSGGAGTGKTVVLVHRARHLARQNPDARIVLTTFNRTLAASLVEQLRLLDPGVRITETLGAPGIYVGGLDQIARRVLQRGAARLSGSGDAPGSVAAVLGPRTAEVLGNTPTARWDAAISLAGESLPNELCSPAFFQAEYAAVVLPNQLTNRDQYLHVRRPGRGTALSRSLRNAVWDVVEAYRASAAAGATTDFEEKAMIAAVDLDEAEKLAGGGDQVSNSSVPFARLADHVLVDEGQDLSPARLHLVRALVPPGPSDIFIAEDSQQRIYGQKIVLSRYGINIRGRSRRLTLNYRTTAQNLRFAVGVLSDAQFVDMEDGDTTVAGYRSARTGPPPQTMGYQSLVDEYQQAASLVKSWINDPEDPTQPETIGILVRNRAAGSKLVTGLADNNIDARFIEEELPPAAGKPLVMTMHRSKGMEFRRVILFDVSETSDPTWMNGMPEAERADARLRDRSLVYVAATRARDTLVVMWKGAPSLLLPVGPASVGLAP